MELVPEGESFDFASDLFPKLMDAGEEIHGAVMPGYWCDVALRGPISSAVSTRSTARCVCRTRL